MQIWLRLSVLMLLLVSPNLLFLFGLSYSAVGGSPMEKIHPAVYILLLAVFLHKPLQLDDAPIAYRNLKGYGRMLVFAGVIGAAAALLSPSGGTELSAPIVTFSTAGLLVVALSNANLKTAKWVSTLVLWFLALNSLIGIGESALDFRILPVVAGNTLVLGDLRPTALLGHALNNAQVTGAVLFLYLMSLVEQKFRKSDLLLVVIHLAALLAFGGRSSIFLVGIMFSLYSIFQAFRGLGSGQLRYFFSVMGIIVLSIPGIYLLVNSGVADVLLSRLVDDDGSLVTRSVAFKLLPLLSFEQWVFGVGPVQRATMQNTLGIPYGIENGLISLTVSYGLPIAALFVVSLFAALFKIGSVLRASGYLAVIYYFLSVLASLSIGSKTTVPSIIILTLFAFGLRGDRVVKARNLDHKLVPVG